MKVLVAFYSDAWLQNVMRDFADGFISGPVFIYTAKIYEIRVFPYVLMHFDRPPMPADLRPNAT